MLISFDKGISGIKGFRQGIYKHWPKGVGESVAYWFPSLRTFGEKVL